MHAIAIILFCTLAAVGYGILHDQVTVRISIEYFTVAHPQIIDSVDSTLLGLVWGVVATWWVGLGLGVLLALAARAGRRPRLRVQELARPVITLIGVTGTCAATAGVIGWAVAAYDVLHLMPPLSYEVPAERHLALITAGFMHGASYLVGGLGGVTVAALTWRRRGHLLSAASDAATSL